MKASLFKAMLPFALITTACAADSDPADAYRDVIPTRAALAMEVPGSSSEAAGEPGAARAALVGERATYHTLTRTVSTSINEGIQSTLGLIERIADLPPSEVRAGFAAWRLDARGLDQVDYKLEIVKASEMRHEFGLYGRPRGADESAFVAIVGGHTLTNAASEVTGGEIGLDFDAGHRLDPVSTPTTGYLVARFDVGSDPRTVEAVFEAPDGSGPRAPGLYRYTEARDGSGTFEFATQGDVGGTPALEDLVVMSRWTADGPGRGDALVSQGDLGDTITRGSECWDRGFGRVYYFVEIENLTEGTEGACAYATPLWSEMGR